MKLSRFLLTAALVGGFLAAAVPLLRPERWFAPPQVSALVEVRVVPRFAPTAESVRREILGDAYLGAAWNRFQPPSPEAVADPNDVLTPERHAARQAQYERWRAHLDAAIEPYFTDDQRQIRITMSGDADITSGAELVQFLAARYAGELSAARWYDAAERMRAAHNQLQAAAAELLKATHGTTGANRSAAAPIRRDGRIVPTAGVEETTDAPRLVAPNATESAGPSQVPQVAELPPVRALPEAPPAPDAAAARSAKLTAAEQQLNVAEAAMRRELEEVLAPRNAEFPIVATAVEGLYPWHWAGVWYFVAAAIGWIAAMGFEAAMWRRPTGAAAGEFANMNSASPAASSATAIANADQIPAIVVTAEDAARAVKAPVLAVVRRRAA